MPNQAIKEKIVALATEGLHELGRDADVHVILDACATLCSSLLAEGKPIEDVMHALHIEAHAMWETGVLGSGPGEGKEFGVGDKDVLVHWAVGYVLEDHRADILALLPPKKA